MTPDEIRKFQGSNYDWTGERLKVDGAIGPKTAWALSVSRLALARQAIVAKACACVGIVEQGTNRGPEIDTWLERAGVSLGLPWCAAFVSWCISVPGMPVVREASAQRLGKRLAHTRAPEPGDVMWFPTGPASGHCGIVIGCGTGEVAVVEGNSSNRVRVVRRARADVRFAALGIPPFNGLLPTVPPGLDLIPVQHEGTR